MSELCQVAYNFQIDLGQKDSIFKPKLRVSFKEEHDRCRYMIPISTELAGSHDKSNYLRLGTVRCPVGTVLTEVSVLLCTSPEVPYMRS
jgi:hypothetical protein